MNITRAIALAMVALAIGMLAGSAAGQVGGFGGPVVVGPGPASQPANVNQPVFGDMRIQIQQGGGLVGGFGEPVVAVKGPASQPGDAIAPVAAGMRIQVMQGGAHVVGAAGMGGGNQASMSMATGDGLIDYSSNNGDEHLKVVDAKGKDLFDGPVTTSEQRKKIPADAVAILKKMVGGGAAMGIGMGAGVNIVRVPKAGAQIMPVMRDPLAELVAGLDEGGRAEEFSRQVGDYTVKVTISAEGKHRATITGKHGKAAFDGPVDTVEQWKGIKDVPAEVVEAAKSMDASLAKESEAKKVETNKSGATSAPDGK